MINATTLSILIPAFLAGVAVLLSHVPLGREVIKRGIIFIDLAIAQIAGLGLIFSSTLGFHANGWELQLIALSSAIGGAFLLSCIERIAGQHQEAIIGITFVLAASASILLLSNNPHGGEHLKDLLVGQILWVEKTQLILPAITGITLLVLSVVAKEWFSGKLFYYFFAFAITISVQLVGVYLVFASLILPALSVARYPGNRATILALVGGLLGYLSGLFLSSSFDLPSGAVIVWTLMFSAVFIAWFAGRFGKALKL